MNNINELKAGKDYYFKSKGIMTDGTCKAIIRKWTAAEIVDFVKKNPTIEWEAVEDNGF